MGELRTMTQYHLLNVVDVLDPRFHDRVILPKVSKFVDGLNIITVKGKPNKYIMHNSKAKTYPTGIKHGRSGDYRVYVIPLDDLMTIGEHRELVAQAETMT